MRKAHADSPGVTFPPPFIFLGFLVLGAVAIFSKALTYLSAMK
jgi:hypothetical protein